MLKFLISSSIDNFVTKVDSFILQSTRFYLFLESYSFCKNKKNCNFYKQNLVATSATDLLTGPTHNFGTTS